MSDEATSTTPVVETPAAGDNQPTETPSPATPQEAAAANDKAYDDAIAVMLSDDAPEEPGETTPATDGADETGTKPGDNGAVEPTAAAAAETEPLKLSDTEMQVLGRLHMTPEMIAGWSQEQREQFLANAQKREADQTASYKALQDKLKGGEQPDDTNPADNPPQVAPDGELAAEIQKVADDAVDNFGDEIKPLADLTLSLSQRLDAQTQQLQAAQASATANGELLVQMTIENGISALVSDYPSLSKDDVRQKVEERFVRDWKAEGSPHRNGQGPLLTRVRQAIAEAAKSELGTVTESAAQVALVNQSKDRLKNQPDPAQGKPRQQPKTEDDLYNQAFDKHLKDEL